ncbi:CPBP family intramembrane glutamic endopeptidase [Proteinivorax hydrogeniformans]|uniref:CPBP family intramembrane glutamic endopeptidase n=1 Tax=Proteinivorax hydrogeniformans TaxID=1826727 RepID=A0AAU8HR73_9FIRM
MGLLGSGVLLFIAVGVAAPLFEEIIFRGLIFDELEGKISLKSVIIIQAVVFGVYHMNIAQGVYTTVMGLFLGLSLVWTGSIWAPILIHAGNNIFSIIIGNFPLEHFIDQVTPVGIAFVLISIFIIMPVSLWYLYKSRIDFKLRNPQPEKEVEIISAQSIDVDK